MSRKLSQKSSRIIKERLAKLDEEIIFLESFDMGEEDFVESKRDVYAALHSLVIGIEAITDIGNHILSEKFGQKQETYKDIIKNLGETDVIPEDLMEDSIKMPDFRNLVIHVYLGLDERKVYQYIPTAITQFKEYSKYFFKFLENNESIS